MTTRRAEARYVESRQMWEIVVQKDGARKAFRLTDRKKSRKGKHTVEARADEWLESGTADMRADVAGQMFLAAKKERTGSGNYLKLEADWRLYIAPVVGPRKLSTITANIWQQAIDAGAANGLSRRSCENIRACIRAFLTFAQDAKWAVADVRNKALTIPNSAAPKKEKTILQPPDIRLLFSDPTIIKHGKTITAHYIHAWRFFVITGLREGELTGLRWEDIGDGVINIRRSINKQLEETYGKNDNARRTFVLTDIARKVLNDQRDHLRDLCIISPWCFPDEYGERSNPKSIYDRYRTYCHQKGQFLTSIHELRHTFVSYGKASVPVELMKALVGHSSDMDTYGIYGHDVDGNAKRTADMVDGIFGTVICGKK